MIKSISLFKLIILLLIFSILIILVCSIMINSNRIDHLESKVRDLQKQMIILEDQVKELSL